MSRELSIQIIQRLTEAGHRAYWAGGCVRDLLRGEVAHDYDVATDASPDRIGEIFGRRRTLNVGASFGVMIVLGQRKHEGQVEVATFRREGEYKDGRRPSSVEFCTAEEDAQRRDFTVNGMFYDPLTETVHDFVGGQEDLKNRVVRAIGRARDRMDEDKLRLLRAVRFTAMLNFELDDLTRDAVMEMASQILVVSAERISQELRKMLVDRHRAHAVRLCHDLNLLEKILPEVEEQTIAKSLDRWELILSVLSSLEASTFETAMAVLMREIPVNSSEEERGLERGTVLAICKRLKLSNEETNRICWLRESEGVLDQLPSQPIAKLKQLAVHPDFSQLMQIERAFASKEDKDQSSFDWIEQFLKSTPLSEINPPELVNGRDLLALGHRPGPLFKNWLTAVREAQLNNEISSREEALELVKQLAEELKK